MKRLLLMLCLSLFGIGALMAQRTVSGTITDADGETLIGANVLVKGTTIGTVTDFEGYYEFEVPDDAEALVISYTGFDTREVELGAQSTVDVVMSEGIFLEEAVVTATGLERNPRNVVYADQTVKAEDLMTTPSKNALEALRGKAAGVRITTGSGSVGASSRIVLRGEGSLTGNNNALIVVDGITIDNSANRGDESGTSQFSAGEQGYSDYGNRLNDINPDDIESVTILKGPSATSLYGSRGASGVVLITTKSGSSAGNKINISLNSSAQMDKAYVLFEGQDRFGQGYDGLHFDSGENWSWGPELDGVVRPWTSPVDTDGDGALESLTRPYSAVPDRLDNFFNTGYVLNNSLSVAGESNGFTYYGSYGNTKQEGILDNTDYIRNSFNFKAGTKISEKVKTDFGISYSRIKTNTAAEGARAFEGQNAYANALQTANNIPLEELRDYTNPFHSFTGFFGSYTVNPYFILNEFTNEAHIANTIGRLSVTYTPLEGLSLIGRAGVNVVNRKVEQTVPIYEYTPHLVWVDDLQLTSRGGRDHSDGVYYKEERENRNIDLNALANYTRVLTQDGDLDMDLTVGWNMFDRNINRIYGQTQGGLNTPGWYHLDNSVSSPRAGQQGERYRIIGAYGNLRLGYKSRFFLEYSARNDWSSTLPAENNSFFYQAVGASAVLLDNSSTRNGVVSFLKLRGSFGTTGKDAQPYLLQSTFNGNPVLQTLGNGHDLLYPLNGESGFYNSGQIGNPNLKPELTTTFEIGADVSFFNDRISLAYTYYNSNHNDQIVVVALPYSSGYFNTAINIGEMENKGHEVNLNLKVIEDLRNKIGWDINVNWAKNENKVIKITDEIDELSIQALTRSVSIVAKEGLPFGTFKGTVKRYDPDGNLIVDNSGFPALESDQDYIGNYQPDWVGSIGSSFRIKGFRLSCLFDFRKGGQFVSYTKFSTDFNGTALTTVNEDGDRQPFVIPGSVIEIDNGDGTFSYEENTTEITQQDYHTNYTAASEELLIDADYVKLRELALSYTLPKKLVDGFAENVTIGVFANNLKFWLADNNTFSDPEINGPGLTNNATGVETSQVPPAQSYGVRLNVNF